MTDIKNVNEQKLNLKTEATHSQWTPSAKDNRICQMIPYKTGVWVCSYKVKDILYQLVLRHFMCLLQSKGYFVSVPTFKTKVL